jgi:hypothetical protein
VRRRAGVEQRLGRGERSRGAPVRRRGARGQSRDLDVRSRRGVEQFRGVPEQERQALRSPRGRRERSREVGGCGESSREDTDDRSCHSHGDALDARRWLGRPAYSRALLRRFG